MIPAGSAEGVALRVVRPFGAAADIEQIIIEVRCGDEASACVTRIRALRPRRRREKKPEPKPPKPPARRLSRDAKDILAVAAIVVAAAGSLIAFR